MTESTLARVLGRLTRPPLLTAFAALQAVLGLSIGLSYLASVDGPLDAQGRPVTGDFMAFYAAARQLDAPGALYDLAAQQALQQQLVGRTLPAFQPYVYPPLLSLLVWPLGQLDYALAFKLFGAGMLLLLVLACRALLAALPGLETSVGGVVETTPIARWTAGLLLCSFHPVLRTAIGGQTTALSLALCMGACAAALRGQPLLAGCLLGLLGYKPQLLLLPLAWLCLAGHGRALAGCVAMLFAHYALGALVLGADWPVDYLQALQAYRPLERSASSPLHVALVPFFERMVGGWFGSALGAAASLGLAGFVLARLRARRLDDPGAWAVLLCASLLASPHLLHYDVALAALAAVLALAHGTVPGLGQRLALAAGYVGYPAYALSASLGVQPLTPYLGWLLYWTMRRLEGSGTHGA